MSIPYATPPVGELRFALPQPVESWQGVRDARHPGPCAPHKIASFSAIDIVGLVGEGGTAGGDYLTLNVWTPEPRRKRPVLNITAVATSSAARRTGQRQDRIFTLRIVCVAINYRLGIDGFCHPRCATNLGLRDMIAALHWVRDNIAAFGGDPGNVTVFGESAGAMAIANLMTSPAGTVPARDCRKRPCSVTRDQTIAQRLVNGSPRS
jgi:para-nitrobenzyl esterase